MYTYTQILTHREEEPARQRQLDVPGKPSPAPAWSVLPFSLVPAFYVEQKSLTTNSHFLCRRSQTDDRTMVLDNNTTYRVIDILFLKGPAVSNCQQKDP